MNRWMIGLLFSLLFSSISFAQPDTLWTRALGDSLVFWGGSIVETTDGVCVAGTWDMPGNQNTKPFVTKLTPTGDVVWSRIIDVTGSVLHDGLSKATNGGYWLAANPHDAGLAVRLNESGDTLWTHEYSAFFYDVWSVIFKTCVNDHFAFSAYGVMSNGARVIYISIFDSAGHSVDGASGYGVTGGVWDLDITNSANLVYLVESFSEHATICLAIQFRQGGRQLDWLTNIQSARVRRGWSNGYFIVANFGQSPVVLKLNANCDTLWQRSISHETSVTLSDIAPTPDGGCVVAGNTWQDGNIYVSRFSGTGNLLWEWTLGDSISVSAAEIDLTSDMGYLIVGTKDGISGRGGLVYVVKTTPDPTLDAQPLTPTVVSGYELQPAFPNPFNPSTTISFTLPKSSEVKLVVYDVTGRLVQKLREGKLEAGEHSVEFNGHDLPSGIYFAQLQASSFSKTEKMVLLK